MRKAGAAAAKKEAPPADESLQLPFDTPVWGDDEAAATDKEEPGFDDEFVLGSQPPSLDFPDSSSAAGEADVQEESPDDDVERPEIAQRAAHGTGARRRRRPGPAGETGKLRALFVVMALVLGGYVVLTYSMLSKPALADRWLGRLPLLGTGLRDRALARAVVLDEVAGSYQQIRGGKTVFVVSGQALNTSRQALHAIRVTGSLHGADGARLAEKTIYCGNVISTRVLKDLSRRELSILQNLNPPPQFALQPGDTSTFVIVFTDVPSDHGELRVRVTAAQRQG